MDKIVIDGAFNDWNIVETVKSYSDSDNDFINKNLDLTAYKLNQDSEYLSFSGGLIMSAIKSVRSVFNSPDTCSFCFEVDVF